MSEEQEQSGDKDVGRHERSTDYTEGSDESGEGENNERGVEYDQEGEV